MIDSGVDLEHPDLSKCIQEEVRVSALADSTGGDTSHGTGIAGVIAAYPSNENGVLGVAENADIISIDVTDDDDGVVQVDNLIEAIHIAIDRQVDIINISIGIQEDNSELYSAVKAAFDSGIVIVASAGNVEGESFVLEPNIAVETTKGTTKSCKVKGYCDYLQLSGGVRTYTISDVAGFTVEFKNHAAV